MKAAVSVIVRATAETLAKLEAFLEANADKPVLATIEEIIDDARNGRMFILVDHEDRENEGDLVIPAQMATPSAINFMATHGRGLICLALTKDRVDQLGLELMSRNNGTRHETAFTVSIEAREGVTTGISAADRARTARLLADPATGREDLARPGHVFPLRARDGGVLVRRGHTEAAVDLCRLAGRRPAGVICEVVEEDGSMSRLPQLRRLADERGWPLVSIADLVDLRRRTEALVERVVSTRLPTVHGEFTTHGYRSGVDGSGADAPPGTVGEVWTKSDQNMLGYWNNPDATAATLTEDGWLKTGDLGRLDAEGYLSIVDRAKDMLIYKGYNVYPRELEELLVARPEVAAAAVVTAQNWARDLVNMPPLDLYPETFASRAQDAAADLIRNPGFRRPHRRPKRRRAPRQGPPWRVCRARIRKASWGIRRAATPVTRPRR